jgi:polyhydroxybutyrate depolymerase
MRDYVLHTPSGYDGTKTLPLVVDLHGATSWATQQLMRDKWGNMADKQGFLVVAPDGVQMTWNALICCGGAQSMKVDDVGFLKAVVAKVSSELCVDSKRVYASGHSNGALMTFVLACQAADIFAAAAPYEGVTPLPTMCHPSRPLPIAMVRALQDGAVPYNGSQQWTSAQADLDLWKALDKCTDTTPVASHNGVCQTYQQCAGGSEVMLCSPRGGHGFFYTPSDNPDNLLVPDTMWPFFAKHALP